MYTEKIKSYTAQTMSAIVKKIEADVTIFNKDGWNVKVKHISHEYSNANFIDAIVIFSLEK